MTKTQKNAILAHGDNLIHVFNLHPNTDIIKLCKQLRRLEIKGHKHATDYCNGAINYNRNDINHIEYTTEMWENDTEKILKKVNKILNNSTIPIFCNGDCRGYCLKINDDYIRNNNILISRDLGGYGIIAPEIN